MCCCKVCNHRWWQRINTDISADHARNQKANSIILIAGIIHCPTLYKAVDAMDGRTPDHECRRSYFSSGDLLLVGDLQCASDAVRKLGGQERNKEEKKKKTRISQSLIRRDKKRVFKTSRQIKDKKTWTNQWLNQWLQY